MRPEGTKVAVVLDNLLLQVREIVGERLLADEGIDPLDRRFGRLAEVLVAQEEDAVLEPSASTPPATCACS